jgi:hypothetical protein
MLGRAFIFLLAVLPIIHLDAASATDQTTECNAVENEASITGSDKLLISTASNTTKKYCRFFVAMPPSLGGTAEDAADVWFKVRTSTSDKIIVQSIAYVAVAAIPKDDPNEKEVISSIYGNSSFISDCAIAFIKGGIFKRESKDNSVQCAVPNALSRLRVSISIRDVFQSTVYLPRPL